MMPVKSKRFFLLILLVLVGFWSILFGAQSSKNDSNTAVRNLFISSNDQEKESVGTVISASPMITQQPEERAFSEQNDAAKIEQIKKADFLALTERILRELPTKRELKELNSREVHLATPQIKESALKLAQVAEILSQSPSLKPQGLEFYQQCSLDDQLLTPVRALCLNRALRLYAELHHQLWPYDRERISRQVVELAGRL